ncbi:MAG: hypothetical protein MAG794_01830 [Gammaproteobacteria bacterium]|nr:hypothetical protein [Gammaproteobacteria bacterium]
MDEQLSPVDKTRLDEEELQVLLAAGEEIRECHRVLSQAKLNVVGECLKNQGTFTKFNHYPKGDVYDWATHSQYYYHTHRGIGDEHGHFHTFMRARGMPECAEPVPYDGDVEWPSGVDAVSHIIAVSMDKYGYPIGLFATNRWVTDETWYTADNVIAMAEHYKIDHAYPNWPVNLWITAMFRLFRYEIRALLEHRDEIVGGWKHEGVDTFEDRNLEVTGFILVTVEEQLQDICKALA